MPNYPTLRENPEKPGNCESRTRISSFAGNSDESLRKIQMNKNAVCIHPCQEEEEGAKCRQEGYQPPLIRSSLLFSPKTGDVPFPTITEQVRLTRIAPHMF